MSPILIRPLKGKKIDLVACLIIDIINRNGCPVAVETAVATVRTYFR